MATKSTKKRTSDNLSSDEENDSKFLQSQQSNGSDDQDFEVVLAKHYAALREKKKKEKEHRFFKLAYKQLSEEISTCVVEDVQTPIQTLESIHEDFLQKYAACEDTIHKLWTQVHKERQKILAFLQDKLTTNIEAAEKVETGRISGLSHTQTACRELREIIRQVLPDD